MARLNYKMDEKPAAEAAPKKDAPAPEKKADAAPDTGDSTAAPDMGAKHASERKDMHQRHETEVRDHNGTMRDARRKIDARHEAEMKAMSEKQDAEMTAGAAQAPGAGAPLPAAGAPGAMAQE